MAKGKKGRGADRWQQVRRLVETGHFDAAEALLRPRLSRGDDALALQWMGVIHFRRSRLRPALDAFGAAYALRPTAELRTLTAQTLLAMGAGPLADREAKAALAMDEEQSEAWAVRADVAQTAGRPGEALEHLRRAHAAEPERASIWGPLALALARACAWDEVEDMQEKLRQELGRATTEKRRPAVTPTAALYVGLAPDEVRRIAELWARSEPAGTRPVGREIRARPRVAFMSPRLDSHPNGLLLQAVLRELGGRYELFGVDWDSSEDEVRSRIAGRVAGMVDLRGRSGASALDELRGLDLDLLVDLGGFTTGQRLELLAGRPARRVVHWLGTPCSMAGFVDARLSCFDWNPPAQDGCFAEALIRWEGPLVAVDELPPVDDAPPPRRVEGSGPLFCNLADGYRIGRRSFARWMGVLRDQPEARLWLTAGTEDRRGRLRAAAEAARVDPERLHFEDAGPLSRGYPFRAADAWLDGAEIGAGTSGILCAWAGVPVVTTPGDTPWSRTGAAVVLAAGGRPARDDEAYLAQARDPPPGPTRGAPLFDVPRFADRFGDALDAALRTSWSGVDDSA